MTHHGKDDWTDEERVQRMAKSYNVRYDDEFWKSLSALTGAESRKVVADFGCGPGLLLVDIANRYSAILAIGLDESKEMLTQAEVFLKESPFWLGCLQLSACVGRHAHAGSWFPIVHSALLRYETRG